MLQILILTLLFCVEITANAASLVDVYQQALTSDPVFQQAIAQRFSDKENVAISFANLLPNIGVTATPSIYKSTSSGFASQGIGSFSQRGYQLNATISQTIFNYAQFANLSNTNAIAKQADATFNTAAQSLILRVATAYFAVLQDEDDLRYATSNKIAYAKQLEQIRLQYKVGLKTITDVYTAQAAYDSSSAKYISTETQLNNDKENLRVITGNSYPSLTPLSENIPLITPTPNNIQSWVDIACKQNWSIKSEQYANEAALQTIKQQFAGNLPTLSVTGTYNITYSRNTGGTGPIGSLFQPPGTNQSHNRTIQLNLNIPVFSGGQVVAQTRQAQYDYQIASQKLEQVVRNTVNSTRQSYLGVIAGISKIHADKQTVKSTKSALAGMQAQYRAGTVTLVDVLNQQEKVFDAEKQYAADRYAYINNLLSLKLAAGTLSPDDLTFVIQSDARNHRFRNPLA